MKLRFFVVDPAGQPIPGSKVDLFLSIPVPDTVKEIPERKARETGNKKLLDENIDGGSGGIDPVGDAFDRALFQQLISRVASAAKANAKEGTEDPSALRLAVAGTRTDRCGYGVIDLARLTGPAQTIYRAGLLIAAISDSADFQLEVAGSPGSAVSLFEGTHMELLRKLGGSLSSAETSRIDEVIALIEQAIGNRPDALRLQADADALPGPQGSVTNPDTVDYELSPDSFVSRRPVSVGDDGCEHITPATLPLRQYAVHHVVVYDRSEKGRDTKTLPSVAFEPPLDRNLRWGWIYEFEQSWTSLGHSLGEVKYSLALAPGEAVKVAVIDWRRDDAASRSGSNASQDALAHEQAVDRDIEDIVSGKVSEEQSGESFMAGLAGAMDFQIPQYGISAAGRHSLGFGMSSTRGTRDLAADAQQSIQLQTLQRSNLVRSQSSSVVVLATQAESNTLSTRIVANMNRGHSLTILYYEVLRHLAINTKFRRADPAVLVPVETLTFTKPLALRYRAQLEPALLDPQYRAGFAALERISVGASSGPAPTPAPTPTPTPTPPSTENAAVFATQFEVKLRTGSRWNGNKYAGPSDTAGSIKILARMADGTDITLAELNEMPLVYENFGHIFNVSKIGGLPPPNGNWSVSYDNLQSRNPCYATYIANVPPIDLKQVRSFAVSWKVNTIGGIFDGWNLQEAWITPQLQAGPLLLGYYRYPSSTGELFGNGADGRRTTQTNQGIPLVNTDRLTGNSAPPPAAPPPADPPPAATGDDGVLDDFKLADILINHLNANRYHYSGAVWLNMDPRELRLRIAPFAGSIITGMSDIPFAMSGNHLAFRYSGDLPAEAGEALPENVPLDLAPSRAIVTLPTRGIFAEAHLGHCNAAEKRDITRLWNFDELPVSLLPNIDTLTAGPRGSAVSLSPDAMGQSPLSVQATPDLPAPGEAIAAALELLAKPDIFRDQSTREQVAEIMGKLIESAQPPKLSGPGIGSAFGGGAGASSIGGSGGTASSPDEWANPFPSRATEGAEGQSFLAETYGSGRTTDETDRLRLAPELANNLFDTGMTQETVEDIISKYTKGTKQKVTSKPKAKTPSFPVALLAKSSFTAGVDRPLYGNITLDFTGAGSGSSVMPTSLLIPTNRGGVGQQMLSLPAGQYTVAVQYRASQLSDLAFLREPQLDSLGVTGSPLIEWVFDLMQRDLATDWEIGADAEGAVVTIPANCTGKKFQLIAKMEQNSALSFDVELGQEQGFTIAGNGKVNFDTNKLGEVATAIAATLKIKQAALVGALLSAFSIQSSIGLDGKSTLSGSEKVKITFKPAILQRFVLTELV